MWYLFGEVSSCSGCLRMGCVILLWHFLNLPYTYFASSIKPNSYPFVDNFSTYLSLIAETPSFVMEICFRWIRTQRWHFLIFAISTLTVTYLLATRTDIQRQLVKHRRLHGLFVCVFGLRPKKFSHLSNWTTRKGRHV